MMNKDARIEELIVRSFTGELLSGERDELNNWLNSNEENKHEYNDYLQIWKGSDRLKLKSEINVSQALTDTRKAAGIEGNRKIFLTLVRIAAIFVLAVCISVVYNKFIVSTSKTETAETIYQQVKAAFGTQSRIELPDGTIVFLNSGSSMRFPSSFTTNETRKVELTGEGHFTVTKNEKQPFIVVTDKFQVEVLGTTFSINAYPGNLLQTVALVEGKVHLIQTGNAEGKIIEMQKNQVCSFNPTDNKFTLRNEENLNKYTHWINGKIVFYDDHINTVVEKLENWYNVEIEIADTKLETYRFTGTFMDEPIEQVLDVLNLTSNMQYKIYSAKKMEDNIYSKRKIVLKSK